MKTFLTLLIVLFCIKSNSYADDHIQSAQCEWINDYITRVENFPIPGINFICYPNLLQTPPAFKKAIQTLATHYKDQGITSIVALEARGFPFGAALAYEMDLPFVMARKKGKLPREKCRIEYGLEYGKDVIEIEKESLSSSDVVLIVDDLMATGGTATAAIHLVEQIGAKVHSVACIFELEYLDGRKNVPADVFSLIKIKD